MMMNILEFFRNLPNKNCSKCGESFEAQADCYGNICEKCDDPAR